MQDRQIEKTDPIIAVIHAMRSNGASNRPSIIFARFGKPVRYAFPPRGKNYIDRVILTQCQMNPPVDLTRDQNDLSHRPPCWILSNWIQDWIVQCFTSPPTQYRLYGRRFLQVKRPNQQYQSTERSYKGKQKHKEHNTHRNTK